MRFVSVIGAIGVGLAIGSAAVLAPLTMGTSSSASTNNASSGAAQWASQWGHQAVNAVRSLASTSTKSDTKTAAASANDAAAAPARELAATASSQDKTSAYLAHSAASGTAKVADARIVQTPWATQVTVAPEAATPKKLTSSKPTSDEQRQNLVRDLQAELKRVGCYDGEPNGQWGAASKRAMASFTERVNASLPFEQPDFILLTLVQGHKGRACGQECPAGQGLASNGRCTPNAILAQADRAKQGDGVKRETVTAAATAAAKANDDTNTNTKPRAGQPASPSIASAWTTTTVVSPLETGSVAVAAAGPAPVRVTRPQQPAQQTAALAPADLQGRPQAAAVAAPVAETETLTRPVTILPGRMTIGAPLPPVLEAAPVPAVKPVRPVTRLAAADTVQPATSSSTDPVTATTAEPAPGPRARRAVRTQPNVRAQPPSHAPAVGHVIKRAPEPVAVRRPPPPPRYYAPRYAGNAYGDNVSGSKSRRMVYEMFQRPDRN